MHNAITNNEPCIKVLDKAIDVIKETDGNGSFVLVLEDKFTFKITVEYIE